MRLLVVRHGNTFESNQTPVWVGANEDPPLTDEGRNQAYRLGAVLSSRADALRAIYFGPLRRTSETATILSQSFPENVPLYRAEALRELDYGQWAGRTDTEIKSLFGEAEFELWQSRAQWPQSAVWKSDAEELHRNLKAFVARVCSVGVGGLVVAVTSGGIARELLRATGALEHFLANGSAPKMRTGSYGVMEFDGNGKCETGEWNIRPE